MLNVLMLDISNKSLLQTVNANKKYDIRIESGTIANPKLYPIPQIIIADFAAVIQSNETEKVLTEISNRIVPKPYIIACMDQWEQKLLNLANCFGIDKTISYDNNSDLETTPLLSARILTDNMSTITSLLTL